jgi:hypothetical protein
VELSVTKPLIAAAFLSGVSYFFPPGVLIVADRLLFRLQIIRGVKVHSVRLQIHFFPDPSSRVFFDLHYPRHLA